MFSKALRNRGLGMELVVKAESVDLMYRAFYKEAMLELSSEKPRLSLVNKFLKAFDLGLNNLKFNPETASNNYIHFSKFDGPTFFNVSFGLEEVSAGLQVPRDEAQVTDLYGKLFQILEQIPISRRVMIVNQHLSTEGDASSFLKSLNPHAPSNFDKLLHGRGVFYTLKIPQHELTIHITFVNSLFIPGGLYLSIENEFSPNLYDSKKTFKVVKDHYDFILRELNLNVKEAPL